MERPPQSMNLLKPVLRNTLITGGTSDMNLEKYLDITPELQEAIKNGEPVVALESTILSHGMPYPENLSFAAEVEKEIRACGAHPATMALIGGKIKVGLSPEELELMCRGENVGKVSRRDFATYLATGKTGATTVASTMMCAALAGIHVFATGGIGGVHRHGEVTMDVSADLQELARTPVAVICAGAKQILDIGRTLEYLETMGVPVIGNGTSDFPAFFCKKSGFGVDYAAQSEEEIARIIKTKLELEMPGGVLIGNPIPDEYAMDFDYMEGIITRALEMADAQHIHGKEITPFLLAHIKELTGGESFASNVQLALNNARCAARIAVSLAKM
jgi:pseudouridine-5'-phosphate glycosidase